MGKLPYTLTDEESMDGFERFANALKTGDEGSYLDPGCVRLMQEIVIRAVQDLFEEEKNGCTNPTDNVQYLTCSARFWLFHDVEPVQPYSFVWICEHLGIDCNRLRRMIRTQTIRNAKGQKFHYSEPLLVKTVDEFSVPSSFPVLE